MLRWILIVLSGGLLCLSAAAQASDLLADDPDVSQFAAWLAETHVTLAPDAPSTLFVPTNEAIESLPSDVLNLLNSDQLLLTRVLQYHIVASVLPSEALESGTLPTQEGDSLTIVHTEQGITVDGVLVTQPDVSTEGLIIHKIDGLLIPPITLPNVDPIEIDGDIVSAGSSTVHPLTQRMADVFSEQGYSDTILVDNIGTGAGLERFCISADTDIANASRAIKDAEREACLANDRDPIEFRVGTDALAIVVSSNNDFVDSLTIDELAKVFGGAETWQDVRAGWPAGPIKLFSPGTDSGTFDYFVEEVFGADPAPMLAAEPTMSEDDEVLVRGAEDDMYAIAYFGYAYYQNHADRLKLVPIDGILPSEVSAENGTYPLARPLYIYSAASILAEKPEVASFIAFYLDHVNEDIEGVGYFPASERALNLGRLALLAAEAS